MLARIVRFRQIVNDASLDPARPLRETRTPVPTNATTKRFLVTGSTGQLGKPTLAALTAAGHDARGLTRRGGADAVAADLLTGHGVDEALVGIDTVVHLATTNGKKDLLIAEHLAAAAVRAKVTHLVVVSIVGIDEIPLSFYKQRVRIEEIMHASGIPLTLQRATQFHSLVDSMFSSQRFLPVVVAPAIRLQPIAVEEVGAKLAELAVGPPLGRVPDIGGPTQRTMKDLHGAWRAATGGKRPAVGLRLPGKLFAAYDAGVNLVEGPTYGRSTFEAYLADKYR
ncbi:SDR family oxidoreductase [Antrihabitans sp. YC3-6]|uniref:SDR family oxidoreductase n=1 Tax=Antrihabitans stalagmiti TaxID=2799499 RepID=A0A934U256_9NOCA|nr:SDR family oxidoreductase [Antrihabitans stalagmiti]